MDVLVVLAHPDSESTCAAIVDDVKTTLMSRGHKVTAIDLYSEGFDPVMSTADRVAYETDFPIVDPQVRRYADLVLASAGIVFVYPTVVGGVPAMLKGWLDRVLVTGVAFELDERTNKIKPAMKHVRRIGAVTTSPARRWTTYLGTDCGRKTLRRTLRFIIRPSARRSWAALYLADRRSPAEVNVFRDQVRKIFDRW